MMRHEQSSVHASWRGPGKVVFRGHPPLAATAADLMQADVVTIHSGAPAFEAAGLMVTSDVCGLPVVDDGDLVGTISEKDLLKLIVGSEPLSKTVADLMTEGVVTCDEETDVTVLCTRLADNAFRYLPVVRAGRLIGTVSRRDILHAYNDRHHSNERSLDVPASVEGPLAGDVMTRGLLTVGPETHIDRVMETLTRWNVTGLPVVDHPLRLIGVVSEKDVLGIFCRPDVGFTSVCELMTTEVVSFEEDTPLFDICTCLARSDFRSVPILNHGSLTGVISRRDLIIYLLRDKSQGGRAGSRPWARRKSDHSITPTSRH